ncbi:hypothetical protein BD410DRAFT_760244 [Rickenella mellea]|uniref:F-box domain-containing protein n=1 Tax=Rickenella mellea TaxID=50990 RepID=A0A4Y7QNQ4_9AGAM|nr:hypothetical protein BD410DRAFT_760244 [Rickenella mellea]
MSNKKLKLSKETRRFKDVLEDARKPDCISRIPMELLAEILSSTSPKDILSLSRCSRYFCHTLANNRSATFIWRHARLSCVPSPIPDPTPNFTEPAYAAFIFDGGTCEACGQHTDSSFTSFSLRLRLCSNYKCFPDWIKNHGVSSPASTNTHSADSGIAQHIEKWMPSIEPRRYSVTPHGVLYRRDKWKEAIDECRRTCPTPGDSCPLHRNAQLQRPKIMELASQLLVWWDDRRRHYDANKLKNDRMSSQIAQNEGWSFRDLLNTPSYSAFNRQKNLAMEQFALKDFNVIRPLVELDLARMHERRQRSAEEQAVREKNMAVANHYQRLKSTKEIGIMPIYPIFRTQPIIKVLRDRKTGTALDITKELTRTPVVKEVLQNELKDWSQNAKIKLSEVLGYANYRSTSDNKLHPVDRLTARFQCTKCMKVGKKRTIEQTLDFQAVCGHQCPNLSKRERSKYQWQADQFSPDTKAITVAREILKLCQVNETDPNSINTVHTMRERFRCDSCATPVLMDFRSALGHSKRHDIMEISISPVDELNAVMKHPIEPGLCAELLGRKISAAQKRTLKIYGCRHCSQAKALAEFHKAEHTSGNATKVSTGATHIKASFKAEEKSMSFDGMRSHLKTKHGIHNIRDEDVFKVTQQPPIKDG